MLLNSSLHGTGLIFDRLKKFDPDLHSHRTVQYFRSDKELLTAGCLNFSTVKVVAL